MKHRVSKNAAASFQSPASFANTKVIPGEAVKEPNVLSSFKNLAAIRSEKAKQANSKLPFLSHDHG